MVVPAKFIMIPPASNNFTIVFQHIVSNSLVLCGNIDLGEKKVRTNTKVLEHTSTPWIIVHTYIDNCTTNDLNRWRPTMPKNI